MALGVVCMVMTSCKKEESWAEGTIIATFEGHNSKTHLDGTSHILNRWDSTMSSAPEQIMVSVPRSRSNLTINVQNQIYTAIDVNHNGTMAEFARPEGTDFSYTTRYGGPIALYYPASHFVSRTCSVESPNYPDYGTFTSISKMRLSFTQAKKSPYGYDTHDWPMYGEARATDDSGCYSAEFYNLCGGLRLRLKSRDDSAFITRIIVYTDNQAITGEYTLTNCPTSLDANPVDGMTHLCCSTYTVTGATNNNERWLTYEPDHQIDISRTSTQKELDICLPCGTYNSFHIQIYSIDGKYCTFDLPASSNLTIRRDELKVLTFDNLHFEEPEGAVFAYYSVSPDRMVYFAHGNLWYNSSTNEWSFAENQWDMLTGRDRILQYAFNSDGTLVDYGRGDGNVHNTPDHHPYFTYRNQADSNMWELFGWSGSQSQNPYGVGTTRGSSSNSQYTGNGFVDWGTLPITNAGDVPYMWRTLNGGQYHEGVEFYGEWDYLMFHRIADHKIIFKMPLEYRQRDDNNGQEYASWAIVRVDTVPGLLLFPDRFKWPYDLIPVSRAPKILNDVPQDWTKVVNYTHAEMEILEETQLTSCGCTFLPATGSRQGASQEQVCGMIRYWLRSVPNSDGVYYIGFMRTEYGNTNYPQTVVPADSAHDAYWGRAVRLAMDAQPYDNRIYNDDPDDPIYNAPYKKQGLISNRNKHTMRIKNN